MADWELWAHMPKATVREAVLLSLGLEPRPPALTRTQYEAPRSYAEPGREYERRLMLAAAHVDASGPLHPLVSMPSPEDATVRLPEFGAWALGLGWVLPEQFLAMSAAQAQEAPEPQAAPVVAESASGETAGPLPLTTGDIAFCFAGLRWDEKRWKKPLADKPKWLAECIALPGQRGVRETTWYPVRIGAALVHQGHASARNVRARFQTQPLLMPWLDAWKTYEADYLDND